MLLSEALFCYDTTELMSIANFRFTAKIQPFVPLRSLL